MIFLLRTSFAHNSVTRREKAYRYFELSHPIQKPSEAWQKVLARFFEALDEVLALAASLAARSTGDIIGPVVNELILRGLHRARYVFEEPLARLAILELCRVPKIRDTALAEQLGVAVDELRVKLLPLTRTVLGVRPASDTETVISLDKHLVPVIMDFLISGGEST